MLVASNIHHIAERVPRKANFVREQRAKLKVGSLSSPVVEYILVQFTIKYLVSRDRAVVRSLVIDL